MLSGVDVLAKAVSVTLGPKGRNVIIEQVRSLSHLFTEKKSNSCCSLTVVPRSQSQPPRFQAPVESRLICSDLLQGRCHCR